jgi:hypothetical protein
VFNSEQRGHMEYLASIPPDQRCWCGWGLAGRCDTPSPCPPDASMADAMATRMPCCGRPADRPDFPRTTGSHYTGCTPRNRDAFAIELELIDLGGEA